MTNERFDLEGDWRRVLREQMMFRAAYMAGRPWIRWPVVSSTEPYGANDRSYREPLG